MSDAHIFFNSDTFDERIKAWKTALQAKRNIDKSLELQNDPEWKDRLGTKEELEAAHTIIRNSLDKAGYALTTQDMQHARKHELLNAQELQAAHTYQAKSTLKSFRKGREERSRDRGNDFER